MVRKRKILFIAPRFHTNQSSLVEQLIDSDFEVDFLVLYKGGSENHSVVEPVLITASVFNRYQRNFKSKKSFVPSIRFMLSRIISCDTVIIRNVRPLYAMLSIAISLLLFRQTVVYTQNPVTGEVPFFRRSLIKGLISIGVVFYSPVLGKGERKASEYGVYVPFVMSKKISRIAEKPLYDPDCIKVCVIGKMQARKQLIEMTLLGGKFTNFVFTIIAESTTKEHKQYENELRLASKEKPNIVIKTNLSQSEVYSELINADVFILPSLKEPAAFSPLEAMACGCLVVNNRENGTYNYIEQGVNGFIYEANLGMEELEEILRGLGCCDIRLMGERSLEMIDKNHGVSNFISKILKH